MDTLEQYLTGAYPTDNQDVAEIERLAWDTCASLVGTFESNNGWPYRLKRDGWAPPTALSQSTTTVVALALIRLLGSWGGPQSPSKVPQFPALRFVNKERKKETKKVVERAAELLKAALLAKQPIGTGSDTYGSNDPITLSFLAELAFDTVSG